MSKVEEWHLPESLVDCCGWFVKECHLRKSREMALYGLSEFQRGRESFYRSMVDGIGWGNGYVIIPRNHKFWHLGVLDDGPYEIDVHGGFTYSNSFVDAIDWYPFGQKLYNELKEKSGYRDAWVFGFDTAHINDDIVKWPKERVIKHTKRLCQNMHRIGYYSKEQYTAEDVDNIINAFN